MLLADGPEGGVKLVETGTETEAGASVVGNNVAALRKDVGVSETRAPVRLYAAAQAERLIPC